MMGMITGTAVFEELRFVWELFAAELIFLFPFTKAKGKPGGRIMITAGILGACSLLYFLIQGNTIFPASIHRWIILAWYMFLVLLSLLLTRYCFSLGLTDAVYIVAAGYSAQHVVYVAVHETLARAFWTELNQHLWLYIMISVVTCAVWYFIIYLIFSDKLSLCEGRISEDTRKGVLWQLITLLVLMVGTFVCQHIFEESGEMRYYAAILDCLICILILGNQYSLCRVTLETREKSVLAQMRNDSARFYTVSKELIEAVNRKSHDMKHVLNALEHTHGIERQQFIDETRREIEKYQQVVLTSYEALNTILVEKSMYCENRKIQMNCVIGDIPQNVVSALDWYVLLGNAIDNAIECVTVLRDTKKRVITVNVTRSGAFISIQINNYYEGKPKMRDGFPVSSKRGKYYHGFGLKSIQSIAVKYGGDISIDMENRIFSLQIMIPVPETVMDS